MEEKKSAEFIIGKYLGVMNKEPDLYSYKKKVNALSSHFKGKAKEELAEITQYLEAVRLQINKQSKAIRQQQKKIAEEQVKIVNKANKLLLKKEWHSPIITKNVEEILAVGLQHLKKSEQVMIAQEEEIMKQIKGFHTLCDAVLIKLENRVQLHLDNLGKEKNNYEAYENGSLMGKALTITI